MSDCSPRLRSRLHCCSVAAAFLPRSSSRRPYPAPRLFPSRCLNPDVHQASIQDTICVPGCTATVRPSKTYTNGVKTKLIRELGLPPADAAKYELDHRIPLALGGHPRNPHNLALQRWDGEAGAKKKDQLERRLQVMACAGQEKLDTARAAVYFDWQGARRKYLPAP